jgi:hypothetical protein
MRFTPCACDPENHKLVSRKWWMRAFKTRHRYRCSACKQVMLLKDAEARHGSHLAFILVAVAAALGAVYMSIGYWEAWSDAQERRVLSREWE